MDEGLSLTRDMWQVASLSRNSMMQLAAVLITVLSVLAVQSAGNCVTRKDQAASQEGLNCMKLGKVNG
jgi:hypothetical protein